MSPAQRQIASAQLGTFAQCPLRTQHLRPSFMTCLQILTQFSPDGTLELDLLEKQRYALWKSTEINKAIREGRAPTAGPVPKPDALADFPPASEFNFVAMHSGSAVC